MAARSRPGRRAAGDVHVHSMLEDRGVRRRQADGRIPSSSSDSFPINRSFFGVSEWKRVNGNERRASRRASAAVSVVHLVVCTISDGGSRLRPVFCRSGGCLSFV